MPENESLKITVAEEKVKLDSHLVACAKATAESIQVQKDLARKVKRLEIVFYISLGALLGETYLPIITKFITG